MSKFFRILQKTSAVFLITGNLVAIDSLSAGVNEPSYSIIHPLDFDSTGWPNDAFMVPPIIRKINAKVIVEVGSWLGASSRILAEAMPSDGVMICVDHWLGSAEHHVTHKGGFLDVLFPKFLSNTIHKEYTNKILPLRISSLDAANILNIQPDLIYLDASHETDAVYADLVAWWPKLRDGGVFCGDDWMWPSVRDAVYRFAKENGISVNFINNDKAFWYFNPKNSKQLDPQPLQPNVIESASLYSIIKPLEYVDDSNQDLTSQLLATVGMLSPSSLLLIEPETTISIPSVGSLMKDFGKVYLIECFESRGNNIDLQYQKHPFHQHLSMINSVALTNVFVPVQMFSMQAAKIISISSPLIYLNLGKYAENPLDQIEAWKSHLTDSGVLCGNLADDPNILSILNKVAFENSLNLEVKDAGFWIMKK